MLQQTRVETVIPYFERFMSRFPTPRALADADEDAVLQAWSGLGYYRRARWLHRGVREVVERYGGEVPEALEDRRALPGVGRYTAGAIGSIAFGRCEPLVDGNVSRVLARLRGIDSPLGRAKTDRALWAHAEALVQGPRPGDLNQALMELGAQVCTPRKPACGACPCRAACTALAQDRVDELPVPRPRKAPARVRRAIVVASCKGSVVLLRRAGELYGGLWELPQAADHGRAMARAALREAGISARLGAKPAGRLEHTLTHRALSVEVWKATAARAAHGRWVPLDGLDELATSKLTRRCVEAVHGSPREK